MRNRIFGMVAVAAALLGTGGASAEADTIRVQSTTDTVDAGLVDGLLKPAYAAAQPGDTLQYTAVGTGKALDNARAGLADVVITHAPSLEAQFVADGFSLEPVGRQIFYSDYVIVGPNSDPAHVATLDPHDAVGALEAIAAAGGAATPTASFLSRGDNSGTNVQEQKMWGLTTTVTKQGAFNAGSDATRFEPGSGGTLPTWYQRTTKGQAANVLEADACPAATHPSGACYTLTDRGTFNKLVNAGTVTRLKILSDHNTPTVRGGENLLINPFSAYIVNPGAPLPAGSPVPNVAAATRFLDFLTSPGFQAAVDTFPTTTDPAFHADAFAKVTLTAPLAPTALGGSTVTIHATLSNKLPGAPAVSGMPVQLQASTDAGKAFKDVGAAVSTGAAGDLTLTVTLSTTTNLRLSMPRFGRLSPNTQDIGVVSATPATSNPPPPAKDTTAPVLSKTTLTKLGFSVNISEAGTVKVTIAKRVAKHARRHGRRVTTFSYKTVKTLIFTAKSAGRLSSSFGRHLSAGSYRVVMRATDTAGNVGKLTVHPHIKSR